ncbi:hypothetical protein LOK49_LG07G02686 [Camellia lanceoleosa]|uniref:Uncharacterized protein n=1 Tax=Camellia lanceoleosa TaxID=1840588 RepID=A0ACC0H0X9_9ERIC|nr:hypothetical protein LOK49_LG07G02686 [Camellia lanceoleosa]
MAKNALGFKRSSAAFDDLARALLFKSSGSEHSAVAEEERSVDLSELVESFLERDCRVGEECDEEERSRKEEEVETKKVLMSLVGGGEGAEEAEDGGVRRMILTEAEEAWRRLGSGSPEGFKRSVMGLLRQRGLDAGLCKSWREKTAQSKLGEHEYIDVIIAKTRYIVELSPTTHFTIARPTDTYASLLKLLPRILVCKEDKLKVVVRLMCTAMEQSLTKRELYVPPWRKNGYMEAKWFGSYKRLTNRVLATEVVDLGGASAEKSLLGFEGLKGNCRGEMVRKVGFRVCM